MRISMTGAYRDRINELKDRAGRARIQVRVDRLAHGNPGQHRNFTHGVSELKIDTGPGYQDRHRARQKFAGVTPCPLPPTDRQDDDR